MTPSPVKVVAQKNSIPLYDGSVKQLLASMYEKVDLALLYAYGEIIPANLISAFTLGFWNIHPSLLPLYRNVAPMVYPLILGDSETGVSIIQLDEKLDHGPLLIQEKMKINLEDTRTDLETKLSEIAFKNFKTLIELSTQGNLPPMVEQEHEKATYTRMMKKEDGYIPFEILKKCLVNHPLSNSEKPAILQEYEAKFPHNSRKQESSLLLYNLYRGLSPWPGIWTKIFINEEEKRLKITGMKYEDGHVHLTKVQLEGKNEVDFSTFQFSYHII
jgi:methionyl-tRNA formyltransferase